MYGGHFCEVKIRHAYFQLSICLKLEDYNANLCGHVEVTAWTKKFVAANME